MGPISETGGSEDHESTVEVVLRRAWKSKLPLAILTVAPTLYLATRIYVRTGDLEWAVGSGIICPLVIYGVINSWLDESSGFARRSWARWCADRSNERPLLYAIAGALVFIVFLTLLWFAGSVAVGQ